MYRAGKTPVVFLKSKAVLFLRPVARDLLRETRKRLRFNARFTQHDFQGTEAGETALEQVGADEGGEP